MSNVNRRRFMTASAASVLSVSSLAFLSACSKSSNSDTSSGTSAAPAKPAAKTHAKVRLSSDPEGLYNVKSISLVVAQVLGGYLLEGLVYLDETGAPQPWLAQSWTSAEDGKTLTFKLKSGKTFHDDTPFNAAAVKAHFDAIMDPANASPSKGIIGPLVKVDTPDDATVVFSFSKPFAPFITLLSQPFLSFNSPTAVQKAGSGYVRSPVGTGPFKFVTWTPGTEIVLARNPTFKQFRADAKNQGLPLLEQITLAVMSEEGVVTAALQRDEVDVATLTADAVAPLKSSTKLNVTEDHHAKNLMFLEFDLKKPPFDDRAFRDAISYSLDRKSILLAAFGGNGTIALSPLSRGIPGFDESVAEHYGTPFDAAKARQLLDAAGWKAGSDGLRSKNGMPANFTIKGYAGSPTERALAVIQANLAAVGVHVEVSTADWGTFYPSLLKPTWDMDLNRWTWSDPSVMSQLFRSPGHRRLLPPNPAIDDALNAADTAIDQKQRMADVSRAQQAILEDRLMVPLLTDWTITVTQKALQGFRLDYNGILYAADLSFAS